MFMYVSFTLVFLNASKIAKCSTVSKAFSFLFHLSLANAYLDVEMFHLSLANPRLDVEMFHLSLIDVYLDAEKFHPHWRTLTLMLRSFTLAGQHLP